MKCHQRKVREAMEATDTGDLFGQWWATLDLQPEKATVREIDYETAASVILRYEWLGSMPNAPVVCHGLFIDGALAAVESYTERRRAGLYEFLGQPAVCLARGACVHWAPSWSASYLISRSVSLLRHREWAYVLAYSDTDAGEVGTVYQASGWFCTGSIRNAYWLSPHGERFDRDHHRTRPGRRSPLGCRGQNVRAEMIACGWRFVVGGQRHRYTQALGTGRVLRERRRFLEAIAIPYPKRAVEASRETRLPNQVGEVGSVPAHGSPEAA